MFPEAREWPDPELVGVCHLCFGRFARKSMSRHLASCYSRVADVDEIRYHHASVPKTFHLAVESRQSPETWLHVEIYQEAPLAELDRFLREIWLECCPHPSLFEIDRVWFARGLAGDEGPGMDTPLQKVLSKGKKFRYTFDPVNPTRLDIRVVSEWSACNLSAAATLVACNHRRNPGRCECGEKAFCECWGCSKKPHPLCVSCARRHRKGSDDVVPVVDSPRRGVCRYRGPAPGTRFRDPTFFGPEIAAGIKNGF